MHVSLQIWTSSGRVIKVRVEYYGLNVYVYAIPDDNGKSKGFCGNLNGDPNDEFEGKTELEFKKKYK